ncbi:MAG: BamA/TamA family outer membrane protein [Zetaproteobacteria bacterium]|nr:BamA/TamA family outer membrane protein [Zetaproteobacteria bacterium]
MARAVDCIFFTAAGLFFCGLSCFFTEALAADERADPAIVSAIHVTGLKYSKEALIVRELPFQVGDLWQASFADSGEKRIRNLALFSEVHITPPNGDGVVEILAKDQWSLWLLPEATRAESGATSAGIALTEHNLWGLQHQLRLATRWNTGKNFSKNSGHGYQVSYVWRRVGDSNWSIDSDFQRGTTIQDMFLNGTFSSSYTQLQDQKTVGVEYGFGAVPGEGWAMRWAVSDQQTSYRLLQGPLLSDVQNYHRKSILWSSRYQNIDDHLTWRTGNIFQYQIDLGTPLLGSTDNMVQQIALYRQYIALGDRGGDSWRDQSTLNLRVKAGIATGTLVHGGLFDMGGKDDMRGYYPGDLQPRGYIYGTAELRTLFESQSNVQWVNFIDVGHLRHHGRALWNQPLIIGVGTGFRWTMRWLVGGTLRADVGYGAATHRWRFHIASGQSF